MFGRKKNKQDVKQQDEQITSTTSNINKMDDEQKQAFLEAMGVKQKSEQKDEVEQTMSTQNHDIPKEEKQKFKSRAERRAMSEGFTRPVAPIPVEAEVVDKARKATKMEQTTIKLNLKNFKLDITIDDLYDTLAEVQDYQSADYTEESWLPFLNTFTQALVVYQSTNPTPEEILIAREAVLIAKSQLIKK